MVVVMSLRVIGTYQKTYQKQTVLHPISLSRQLLIGTGGGGIDVD